MKIELIPATKSFGLNHELELIYNESFTRDERRNWQELKELLDQPNFNLNKIFCDRKTIGLMTLWKLAGWVFIEHFAIQESMRGKGIGSQVLKQLIERDSTSLIVEVEEPITGFAQRRIAFYSRIGFSLCENTYYQPPYSIDKNEVRMFLMSFPEPLSPVDFDKVKSQIYQVVYGVT